MDLRLGWPTVIVTGSSRGIGLAVTRGLAAAGVRVTVGALRSPTLVLILASDRTANVTDTDVTIDGGLIPTW